MGTEPRNLAFYAVQIQEVFELPDRIEGDPGIDGVVFGPIVVSEDRIVVVSHYVQPREIELIAKIDEAVQLLDGARIDRVASVDVELKQRLLGGLGGVAIVERPLIVVQSEQVAQVHGPAILLLHGIALERVLHPIERLTRVATEQLDVTLAQLHIRIPGKTKLEGSRQALLPGGLLPRRVGHSLHHERGIRGQQQALLVSGQILDVLIRAASHQRPLEVVGFERPLVLGRDLANRQLGVWDLPNP